MNHIVYLSHGGGPLPLLGEPSHAEMVGVLQNIAAQVGTPAAIIVISAHWEADRPSITSAAAPPLVYDYSGFPPAAYAIEYPAPGNPPLAREVSQCLENHGIAAQLDEH